MANLILALALTGQCANGSCARPVAVHATPVVTYVYKPIPGKPAAYMIPVYHPVYRVRHVPRVFHKRSCAGGVCK